MKAYGTNVSRNRWQTGEEIDGIPVFNTVQDAVKETGATHLYFVPAAFAKDAMMEAAAAGIKLIFVLLRECPH